MRVSIVINTYNRCASLCRTLDSLSQLRYPAFEVVVVNGPSADGTRELLDGWGSEIKVEQCAVANLSISRNIGIAAAAGDIVAFIDDDAIPDPQWLDRLVQGFDSEEIAAVGGPVYDNSGYTFQAKGIVSDRFGSSEDDIGFDPTPVFNLPDAARYTSLLGTNSSFRRSVLIEVAGFDEAFAYYLDETDLCLRIVDRGYVVKYVPDAFIYHKFESSDLRLSYSGKGVLLKRYQPLRSKAYFAIKHGAPAHGYIAAMQAILAYADWHRRDVEFNRQWCLDHGYPLPPEEDDLETVITKAVGAGIEAALTQPRRYLSGKTLSVHAAPFKPFVRRNLAVDRLNICLFTQSFPPSEVDGIGRALHEFSTALAALGHTVHVLTTSRTQNRVDFEEGVWIHRLLVQSHDLPCDDIPQHIWNYSRTMMDEVERINRFDPVDIIEAPAWDCEGVAPLLQDDIPLITSLHTPMLVVASMHRSWMTDSKKMVDEILPIIRWERRIMVFSDGLAANTELIVDTVEREYELSFDRSRVAVVGRGFHDQSRLGQCSASAYVARHMDADRNQVRILFLGRLEYRKGIDVLLAVLRQILPDLTNVYVDIVGEDVDENAYATTFAHDVGDAEWLTRVTFHGRVPQELLYQHFANCDIFVAPSRFESFGLIYLQAMMYGKPCIGTRVGGISEVVIDEQTGILVEPGDQDHLAAALLRLILDPDLRARLGQAGRYRYSEHFTARAWAERAVEQYKKTVEHPATIRRPIHRSRNANWSRFCDLSEFWIQSTLYPILKSNYRDMLDWRAWASAAIIATLRRHPKMGSRSKALVVADPEMPPVPVEAAEWPIVWDDAGTRFAPTADDRWKRPRMRLAYGAAEFDLLWWARPLDPLDEGFGAAVAEIARVSAIGAPVYLLLAAGVPIAEQHSLIDKRFTKSGLISSVSLEELFAQAPTTDSCRKVDQEPSLGVVIDGQYRPIAVVEFRREPEKAMAEVIGEMV